MIPWYDNEYVRETLLPSLKSSKTGKVQRVVKTYKYPYFVESSELIEDSYWSKVAHDMARGKFMSGFYYDGKVMTYQKKDSFEFSSDPAARAKQIVSYHQKHGHWSPDDIEYSRRQGKERFESYTVQEFDWQSLSKMKYKKQEMILTYVRTKYSSLSKKIQDQLITQIQIFLSLKMLENEHIYIENGKIVHIEGLDANEEGIFVTGSFKNPTVGKTSKSKESRSNSKYLDVWNKFLTFYVRDLPIVEMEKQVNLNEYSESNDYDYEEMSGRSFSNA